MLFKETVALHSANHVKQMHSVVQMVMVVLNIFPVAWKVTVRCYTHGVHWSRLIFFLETRLGSLMFEAVDIVIAGDYQHELVHSVVFQDTRVVIRESVCKCKSIRYKLQLLSKSFMFRDITPCSPLIVNRRFRRTCCLNLQGLRISHERN
jgi:hypothetical protein